MKGWEKEETRDKKKKNGKNWILRGKCKCGYNVDLLWKFAFFYDGRKAVKGMEREISLEEKGKFMDRVKL